MKILFADLSPTWRGGQNQALLLLTGLRACGHVAELVAPTATPLAQRARDAGIRVHGLARRGRWECVRALRRLLRANWYDLLHLNEPHALTAAWLAGAHRRLPMVVARRVAYPIAANPLAQARYRAARRILAISKFVAKSVTDSGLPLEQIELVYEGIEIPELPTAEARRRARESWGIKEREPLLGCVGYLLPEKGQEFLLRAIPAIRAQFPECGLLLAGDGPCRRRLVRLARELGIEAAVRFVGFVEDISRVYVALDVFLFPSLAEPLGTSLLAAMAYALPVVAIDAGGVPEIVTPGHDGLLVASPDAGSIATASLTLLQDRTRARQLGDAARATAQQRFSSGRMVEDSLRSFERVRSSEVSA